MKTCTKCLKDKPESDFHRDFQKSSGYRLDCKECNQSRVSKWQKDNPEKKNARQRQNRRDKIDHYLAREKNWRKANRRKIKSAQLKHNYGISIEDYEAITYWQGGKCAIEGCDNTGDETKVKGLRVAFLQFFSLAK